MSESSKYRQRNFTAVVPRRQRTVHIDRRLYAAVAKMARRQQMSVGWFIEEVLEIAVGVDAKLKRTAAVKPAFYTRRSIGREK